MRRGPWWSVGTILGAAFLLPLLFTSHVIGPGAVYADCGRERPSRDMSDYRGQAFTGRVLSIERAPEPGSDRVITFDVDEVLAGAVPDPYVVLDSGGDCGTFRSERLREGQRVLASIGAGRDPDEPGHVFSVLLWRSTAGGWRFAEDALWGGDVRHAFPPKARAATTREAITTLVGGPALAAIPAGPAVAPVQDVEWTPVEGVLGGGLRGLRVELDELVAWGGRFWALEDRAIASSRDDERIVWHEPAVWESSDGMTWERSLLPRSASDQLSLVAWGERLALIEQRYIDGPQGLDVRVWTRAPGQEWRRFGRLRVPPEGRYRGCAFTYQDVAATARTLVVTASCLPLRGAGGWVGSDIASLAATQAMAAGGSTYPTYSWTSTDGRHWTRHHLFGSPDTYRAPHIVGLWAAGGGVAAWLDRETGQELQWSPDGARFTTIGALPTIGPDLQVDEVHGVALVPRGDGGVDWLLLLAHLQHDADHRAAPGTSINLWRLDPEGSWTIAQSFGADTTSGALSTEGRRVAVIATAQVPDGGAWSSRRTGLSTDAGRSFVISEGRAGIDYECQPLLAMLGTTAVTTCDEADGPLTRRAIVWAHASEP